MTEPSPALRARWEARLEAEGLGVLMTPAGWTFPGGADHEDTPAPGPVVHTTYARSGKVRRRVVICPPAPPARSRTRTTFSSFTEFTEAEFEETLSAADTAKGVFWRRAAQAAHDLPRTFKHRAFLRTVAEQGYINGAARAAGLSRKQGRVTWAKFLSRAGLPEAIP